MRIPCRDLSGRPRALGVCIDSGRVLLIAPPGETAVLSLLEVDLLRAALADAVADGCTGAQAPNPTGDA